MTKFKIWGNDDGKEHASIIQAGSIREAFLNNVLRECRAKQWDVMEGGTAHYSGCEVLADGSEGPIHQGTGTVLFDVEISNVHEGTAEES
jgi:hypothetical protein